jgi:hypothetical protein
VSKDVVVTARREVVDDDDLVTRLEVVIDEV